jgi:hypothetical protein
LVGKPFGNTMGAEPSFTVIVYVVPGMVLLLDVMANWYELGLQAVAPEPEIVTVGGGLPTKTL